MVIGIGGSYLGIEFVYEALRFHQDCAKASEGRRLRFLANVDPNDFARATFGLDPETTLVVVISKTFTTAETMLNAKTAKNWILEHYK
jgi:glucose-6-phosphate isomerase